MKKLISILLFSIILITSILYQNIIIANASQINYFDKLQITKNTELEADHYKDIAFNGTNTTVIVGVNGKILTSLDGEKWVVRNSGTDANLSTVIWYNNMFITFGDNNTILESPDGTVWHKLKEIKNKKNMDIKYKYNDNKDSGNTKLNFMFSDGKNFIGLIDYIQADGPGWDKSSVRYEGIYYSKDSKSWSQIDLVRYKQRARLGKLSVAVSCRDVFGQYDILVYDGDKKLYSSYNSSKIKAIASNGKKVVCVSGHGDIFSSGDGCDWKQVYRIEWYSLNGIVWTGKCFIAVGDYGKILTSNDGVKWIDKRMKASNDLNNIIWDGKNYIIVGNLGTIYASNNCKNWTRFNSDSGINTDFKSIIFDEKKYIAVGDGYRINVVAAMMSKDSKKWEPYLVEQDEVDVCRFNNCFLLGGRYILINDSSVLFSKDCVKWSSSKIQPIHGTFNDMCFNGKQYVMVGDSEIIATSENCENWKLSALPKKECLSGVACNSRKFVAVGYSGKILTSSDGVKWTYQNSGTDKWLKSVAWNGKYFIAVGEKGTIILSENGENWEKIKTNNLDTLNKVICKGNDLLIVGNCGTLLTCKFKQ